MIKFIAVSILLGIILTLNPLYSISTRDFFRYLEQVFVIKKIYQRWSKDRLPYSRNKFGLGRINVENLSAGELDKLQASISIPQHTIPDRFFKNLHFCSHKGYQTWIQLSSIYHTEIVTEKLLEHCIQLSSKGVGSEVWEKELGNIKRLIQFLYTVPKSVILEQSLSPELVSPLNDLVEEWNKNIFKYSNFNAYPIVKLQIHEEIFRYVMVDFILTIHLPLFKTVYYGNHFHFEYQKMDELLEKKIYNPLTSQQEKLNEIRELKKHVKSKQYFTFYFLFAGIEMWKEDIPKRNQYLLSKYTDVSANLKSNPNISQKNKNIVQEVLDCFKSWNEEKLSLYSLDYYAKFYIDYHSNHHRLIPTKDEESRKLIEYFDSVYFDSYFFEGRLKEIHRECKKIQKL